MKVFCSDIHWLCMAQQKPPDGPKHRQRYNRDNPTIGEYISPQQHSTPMKPHTHKFIQNLGVPWTKTRENNSLLGYDPTICNRDEKAGHLRPCYRSQSICCSGGVAGAPSSWRCVSANPHLWLVQALLM